MPECKARLKTKPLPMPNAPLFACKHNIQTLNMYRCQILKITFLTQVF